MDYRLFIDQTNYKGDLKVEGLLTGHFMSGFDGLPRKGDTITFLYFEGPPVPMRGRRALNLELSVTEVNHYAVEKPSLDSFGGLRISQQKDYPRVYADLVRASLAN